MTGHWQYLTHEGSGTGHLAGWDAAAQTLCGIKFTAASWIAGDETLAGPAATCGRCRRAAGWKKAF
jgi:hypothetical protein